MIFLFPLDLNSSRGDSKHANAIINNIALEEDAIVSYRSSRFLRLLYFYVDSIRVIFSSSSGKVYFRYNFFSFFLFIATLIRGKQIFVEMNAVIEEEIFDRRTVLSYVKLWVCKIDFWILKHNSPQMVCVTQNIADYYESKGFNVSVVENGFESQSFQQSKFDNVSRLDGRLVLTFVGTLAPWQDLEIVIEALWQLQGKYDFVLNIVGDGSEESSLRALVGDLGLSDVVHFHGRKPHSEAIDVLANTDICVATLKGSRLGNTGTSALKIFEYLAAGKIVVTTNCGSSTNFLKSVRNVHLCERDLGNVVFTLEKVFADLVGSHKYFFNYENHLWSVNNHSWSAKLAPLRSF